MMRSINRSYLQLTSRIFLLTCFRLLLLSIRAVLLMALEELKRLGEQLDGVFRDDPQWEIRAELLENVSSEYKRFVKVLKEEVTKPSRTNPTLLAVALETDYNREDITWVINDHTLQEGNDKIEQYISLGHFGSAYILQTNRLVQHPHLASKESGRFIRCRTGFLSTFEDSLKLETLEAHIPKELRGSQLFIPKELLTIPSVMKHVRDVGLRDCLGRSVSHIAFDAGLPAPWSQLDLNSQDVLQRTAFHLACMMDDRDLLLRCGSTAGLRTVTGLTPLHIAAIKGRKEICMAYDCTNFAWILDCVGRSPLACAVSCGQHDIVDVVFSCSCWFCVLTPGWNRFIFRPDLYGNTPISLAVRRSNLRMVDRLLNYKFAADIPDKKGRTPFWYAVEGSELAMMRLLEDFVNPDHRDKEGRTPLSEAARMGNTEAVLYLLNRNIENLVVNPFSMDIMGETPLTVAVAAGHSECVRILLEHPSFRFAQNLFCEQVVEQNRHDTDRWKKTVIKTVSSYRKEYSHDVN